MGLLVRVGIHEVNGAASLLLRLFLEEKSVYFGNFRKFSEIWKYGNFAQRRPVASSNRRSPSHRQILWPPSLSPSLSMCVCGGGGLKGQLLPPDSGTGKPAAREFACGSGCGGCPSPLAVVAPNFCVSQFWKISEFRK